MLKKRIIPLLLLIDGRLVKSVNFDNFNDVGNPVSSVKIFNNSDADENDRGFQSGLSLKINEKWKFTYLFKDIESDSTFGALTHSYFGGGGAGHKGHQFNLSYPITERFSVDLVWFDNKKKMITDYNKIFVDFKYKL